MPIARARTDDGIVTGERDGETLRTDEGTYTIGESAELLAPCEPSALYCVGRNYAETIELRGYDRPDVPEFFIKPPTSVLGPEEGIPYPTFSEEVTYAGELAAVIGERCRNVSEAAALDYVRGYTIMNDVDALDQNSVTARKAFDGSGPLGPHVATDVDPTDIDMYTDVNGERRQEANTSSMLFDPAEVIAFLSERLTLRPDDVVAFGSPANPGTIEPGDVVEITYEGVGTLRNEVR